MKVLNVKKKVKGMVRCGRRRPPKVLVVVGTAVALLLLSTYFTINNKITYHSNSTCKPQMQVQRCTCHLTKQIWNDFSSNYNSLTLEDLHKPNQDCLCHQNYHHYPIVIYKGQQLSKTNQDELYSRDPKHSARCTQCQKIREWARNISIGLRERHHLNVITQCMW